MTVELRQEGIRLPSAEGGGAEDEAACAGAEHELAAQGVDLPGVSIQHEEARGSLLALHQEFLQSIGREEAKYLIHSVANKGGIGTERQRYTPMQLSIL
jgi:hypothetical protein